MSDVPDVNVDLGQWNLLGGESEREEGDLDKAERISRRKQAGQNPAEANVSRFHQACYSLGNYQLQSLTTAAEVEKELQTTRKFGCSSLRIALRGPEIDRAQGQPFAAFVWQLP